ncbi:MAG: hypothetical protein OEY52_09810 [Gammaproteobacteria bacterium]|nr:hypothetical protein [Gammaproteobacteria bacterium]
MKSYIKYLLFIVALAIFSACGGGGGGGGDGTTTDNTENQGDQGGGDQGDGDQGDGGDVPNDPGPSPADTVAYGKAMVVGGWAYYGSANKNTPWIHANYFICPSGGMKGIEETSDYVAGKQLVYLAEGKWNVTKTSYAGLEAYPTIHLNYTTTTSVGGVKDSGPGLLGGGDAEMIYVADSDTIQYWFNSGWHVMKRLIDGSNKEVDDSYCGTSSSSTKQCGTDADCGRCWYCDKSGGSSQCRYGGEGPLGCYRGWEPPE